MEKKLFYFGCIDKVGHYWFWGHSGVGRIQSHLPEVNSSLLDRIDGIFPPADTLTIGIYNYVVVEKASIISWWDTSVDKRPGSNSTFIGIGYTNADEMLDDACILFPSVMNRQPRPTPNINP